MTSSLRSAVAIVAILLGTGYPRPDANHASAATAIVAGHKWFLVDAGRNVTMRIAGAELKYDEMQAVFLTHFHSDHIAGLPDVFQTSWQFGRETLDVLLLPANLDLASEARDSGTDPDPAPSGHAFSVQYQDPKESRPSPVPVAKSSAAGSRNDILQDIAVLDRPLPQPLLTATSRRRVQDHCENPEG